MGRPGQELIQANISGRSENEMVRTCGEKDRGIFSIKNVQVQESATDVVWPRKEARSILRRKKDSEYGTTRETKARKTEAEMDGLCQSRHESHRNDERRGT